MDPCSKPGRKLRYSDTEKSQASQWEKTKGHVGTVHACMHVLAVWGMGQEWDGAMQEARAAGRTHEGLLQ